MDYARRESLVVRINLGCVPCGRFKIWGATLEQKLAACSLRDEVLIEAKEKGCLTSEECRSLLKKFGLWSDEKNIRLNGLDEQIDDMKVSLLDFVYREKELAAGKEVIRKLENEQTTLVRERERWSHATAEGVANQAKTNFLLLAGLREQENPWEIPDGILDELIVAYQEASLGESEFRELARTEPWRSIWNCTPSARDIFGVPAALLTEEQKTLCAWSKLYDDVRQHSEAPSSAIIDDDDLFDGWLIRQNRKRDAEESKNEIEGRLSPKTQNADEIFLVAGSQKEVNKIYQANSPLAKSFVRQKLTKLQREGRVEDVDMPDTQLKLKMEKNKRDGRV